MACRAATQHSCAGRRTIKVILPSAKVQLTDVEQPSFQLTVVLGKPCSSSHCCRTLTSQATRISRLKMLFQHFCNRSRLRNRKNDKTDTQIPPKKIQCQPSSRAKTSAQSRAKRFHEGIWRQEFPKTLSVRTSKLFPDQKTNFSWKHLGFSVFLNERGKC